MIRPPALDDIVPKGFRGGTHRSIPPEETVRRLRPLMPRMGITRLATITGLDRVGIPVVVACRPNSRSLAVSQGKGLDLAAAQASALMESVEAYHAEHITLPLKLASYEELRYTHRVVDVERLPRLANSVFHPNLSLLWIEGWDIFAEEPVWLPYELARCDYTLPDPIGSGCFYPSSNGLASGNHVLEAVSHGLSEVVERDALTRWHLLDDGAQQASRLDLDSVDDPACRMIIDRYAAAGIGAAVWDATSDVGLPTFHCVILERATDPVHPDHASAGMGCHPTRTVALLRALTEAAQSRLTVIAGSRDDLFRRDYLRSSSPDVLGLHREILDRAGPRRAFQDVPTYDGDTVRADVSHQVERLRAAGLDQVVVVDLTRPEFQVSVARVVVPGLEPPSHVPGYQPGRRARAWLAQAA
jgi:ribosomal protein S12 methylthiotransferase accessory factor